MIRTIAAAIVLAAVAGFAAPAGAVDFSCREARLPAERAICADQRLSGLDETMATVYGRVWSKSGDRARAQLRTRQLRFLEARNECRWDAKCIRDAYLDQISVLDSRLDDIARD